MKRYFFFAASYQFPGGNGSRNFGIVLDDKFPSMEHLKDVLRSQEKTASGIVILSICELSEADYKHLFAL
jgi:hypothetical protein